KDVTDFHRFENFQCSGVAAWTILARVDCAQIGPLIDFDVALDIDAANVTVVFVGAGGHVATTAQIIVSDNRHLWKLYYVLIAAARDRMFVGCAPCSLLCPNCTQSSCACSEYLANLFRLSLPYFCATKHS